MEASVSADGITTTYINGFQLGLSNADVSAILLQNNVPILNLLFSYTTAKSLAVALNDMVVTLEKVTNHTIMTADEVGIGLEKIQPDSEATSK